jgi:hypothetical protein
MCVGGDPIVYLGGGVGEEENFYFSSTHTPCALSIVGGSAFIAVGNTPKFCGFDIVNTWTERCGFVLNIPPCCRFVRRLCQNLYWRKCYVEVNICGCCCCRVR